MDLAGKVAIVTGGSAGIGLAVTRRLATAGAKVAIVGRGKEALDRAVAEVGGRAYALDVGDLEALAALPARVVADLGRLDIVVNNAGAHHRGLFEKQTTAGLAEMVHVNLAAPIVLIRAALDHLPRGGAIVNIGSLSGYVPLPEGATYASTKAALRFLTIALAQEFEARGVRVAVVNPGPVDTGFFGDVEKVSPLVFSQPMSTADEVAAVVMRALDGSAIEWPIPPRSATLATLAYLFPTVARWLRPRLAARGERAKRAYMARKGSGSANSSR